MGNVSTFTRTPTGPVTATTQAAAVAETPPKKVKNPAMETEVKSVKFQDVTTFMFQQLVPGEICRFGEGWITRCPECDNLISMDSEFKTFRMKSKDMWRLAPSLSCPNDECGWHRSVVIDPEEFEEEEEDLAPEEDGLASEEEEEEEEEADEETAIATTGEGADA